MVALGFSDQGRLGRFVRRRLCWTFGTATLAFDVVGSVFETAFATWPTDFFHSVGGTSFPRGGDRAGGHFYTRVPAVLVYPGYLLLSCSGGSDCQTDAILGD